MELNIPDILYRNDEVYGEGITDIIDVICYEITELYNVDIPSYCMEHYDLSEKLQMQLEDTINLVECGADLNIFTIRDSVIQMVQEISAQVGKELQYVIWLAGYDDVVELYDGTEDNITSYKTSDVILSDLGSDGMLFAYEYEPEPIG